jgi:K+ transporter
MSAHCVGSRAALRGAGAMVRSSQDATTYFQIPTDRVVEIGTQVGI